MSSIGHKLGASIRCFIINTNLSRWLLIFSLMISAVMMHPSFAALFALGVNVIVLFSMRKAAMIEAVARFKSKVPHPLPNSL